MSEVKATPPVIIPNGDSADHAAEISYTLSRDATVSIWFRDDELPRNPAGKVLKRDLRDELIGSG